MRAPSTLAALALLLACAAEAGAQVVDLGQSRSRYEDRYGAPVEVALTDIVQNSASYEGRAVRTHGRLDLPAGAARGTYALRDAFGGAALIVPVREVSAEFDSLALTWVGQELGVTGVVRTNLGAEVSSVTIAFWEFVGPPEREAKGPVKAADVTLQALVTNPGKRDGDMVRAVGKFRGRNLYGDLPVRSQRASSDWVIKDDLFAVWVTGKKPKGSGWELDPALKRDTGKWIEVVGRPETRGGITYLRAVQVALAQPPTPTAEAQAPPPPPERPKVPPVVVFALPLDGEQDVAPDSRFVLQFSKDMDESSFKGRVVLRYTGPRLPGDREFDGVTLRYDQGLRALTVDPGDVLRRGRRLELLLLPGIADVDGLALTPRPGKQVEGAVDVLRFEVGT